MMRGIPLKRRRCSPQRLAARLCSKRRYIPARLEWLEDRIAPALGTFELDGNATTQVTHDWDQVYNDAVLNLGQDTSGAIPGAVAFVRDPIVSPTDDIFTGGSSADINQISQLRWKPGPAPQQKADIANIYAAVYSVPVADGPNHTVVKFGADRINSAAGNATLGFWFFQNPVGKNPDGTFSGARTVGDIFVVVDFDTGADATISAYRWVGPGGSQSSLQLLPSDPTNISVITNTVNIPTGGWPFTSVAPAAPANTMAPGQFVEGGIDLTALGLPDDLASLLVESRSSTSLVAGLSDLVGPLAFTNFTADLAVTKTVNNPTPVIGDNVTFTVSLTNTGPNNASSVIVNDVLPPGLTFVSDTPSPGTTYDSTTGVWTVGDVARGQVFTLQIVATVESPDTQTNTATVPVPDGLTDPDLSNNTASDTVTPQIADLAITKTDGQASAVPGGSTSYTIVVSNAGPVDVTGASVFDPLPIGVTGASWRSTASSGGGSVSGPSGGTGALATTVDLPVGASITFSFTVQIDPAATGTLTNTATVTPPAGTTDPNPANNSATDTDTLTPQADLVITKDDGQTTAVPGTLDTYIIVVSNAGPSAVTGASVSDPLPPGVIAATWTVAAESGGGVVTGPASGTGALATTVDLPVNATVTFTFTVRIDPSATGTLINTASVAPPAGVTDPNPVNNSATDTDDLTPQSDLAITKTDDVTFAVPGTSTTYIIVVSNKGPSTAVGQAVTDHFPADITAVSWTAVASAGSSVAAASGTGDIVTTVTLVPGGIVTFTAVVAISPAATGTLSNTATVALPPGDNTPENNSATDTNTLTPLVDLAITKTDGQASAVPGGSTSYTIVVSNAGPSTVTGASVFDPLPVGVTAATWTVTGASDGGVVTGPSSGVGGLATTVDLPVNASITFSFTVRIDPAATGTLTNTASVAPPAGVTDSNPANDSATDTNTLTPQTDLSISKTDGVTSVVPGTSTVYTIVVRNAGPSAVTGASVSDALPAGAAAATWTVAAESGGGVVTGPATGTGALATSVDLPVNASVTFTFTVQIDPSATGTLSNTATISPPTGTTDPNPGNDGDTDTNTLTPEADLAVAKTVNSLAPLVGDLVTFIITLSNKGPSTATGVLVTDRLPNGLVFVAARTSQGTYNPTTGEWTVGKLDSGASAVLVVDARVASVGPHANLAEVTGLETIDPIPGNNASSVVVTGRSDAPPTVTSLKRFGFHAQPIELVLTFSSPLDPARARDPNNYLVTAIGQRGKLGPRIPIASVDYLAATRTVILYPAKHLQLLGQRHRLVVNGMPPNGLRSPSGTLLDGDGNGEPGSNFTKVFGREILAGPFPGFTGNPGRFTRTVPTPSRLALVTPRGPQRSSANPLLARGRAVSAGIEPRVGLIPAAVDAVHATAAVLPGRDG